MAKRQVKRGTGEEISGGAIVHYRRAVVLPEELSPPEGLTKRRIGGFGWRPDSPDPRDQYFSVAGPVLQALPASVNLRSADSPIYNQGRIGSCTANAIAGAIQFDRRKLGLDPISSHRACSSITTSAVLKAASPMMRARPSATASRP